MITDDLRGVDTLTGETQATVMTEATVKVHVDGERHIATAEGNGPVNALDRALRSALNGRFPALERVHLTDYKVRVLDTQQGHRRGHAGADRLDRRRRDVDDDRREREHHRGVLAGAARLDPVRAAARARERPAGLRLAFRACRPIRSFPPIPPTGPASSRTCRRAPRCRRRGRWRARPPRRPRRIRAARGPPVRHARARTSATRTRSPSTSRTGSS